MMWGAVPSDPRSRSNRLALTLAAPDLPPDVSGRASGWARFSYPWGRAHPLSWARPLDTAYGSVDGREGEPLYRLTGVSMCRAAPGLLIEADRLESIGGELLGIVGDASHVGGFHDCTPPAGDYSMMGAVNRPFGLYACAIDIGMEDWPASRDWLAWLITEIREDRITNIAEVIGSLDGVHVRYWSDSSGWHQEGEFYTGTGHGTWAHVAIYRATALEDHRILAGWTSTGMDGGTMELDTVIPRISEHGPDGKLTYGRTVEDQMGDVWVGVHGVTQDILATVKRIENADSVPIELTDADIVDIAEQVSARIEARIASAVVDELVRRLDPRS